MTFLTNLGVTEVCSFRLVLERKASREKIESSKLEFVETYFALLDAEGNTLMSLSRGGVADLPLLRTLSAIRQKVKEKSFWEVIGFFVLLA